MANGSDPSTRVGACNGYKCSCKAYDETKADRMWPTCRCRHTQQAHAKPEPVLVVTPEEPAEG